MPELHLSLLFRFILLLLAAVCSILLSFFVYRSTVPPVSSAKKTILISFRSLGLFLLFLLLGEPLLSLVTHSVDQPIVAVLIDHSQSMALSDRTGPRQATVKSILHAPLWNGISKYGRVVYSLFDSKVKNLTTMTDDSLTFKGESTDIAEALKSIKQQYSSSNLQAVVLVTDGNSTVGMNPLYEAEELGLPIFTVGVGDTIEQKDLLIRKALTNDITYAGAKVPVHVTVHSAGFGGEEVEISLRDGAIILDKKSLMLERGTRDYLVPLTLTTEKIGIQKFTAEVSSLPGELTQQNNRTSFFIKVLKSKMHIALIAGAPSQDAAFIRRALQNDKNNEVLSFTEQNNGQFHENTFTAEVLSPIDCMILVGFPTTHSSLSNVQTVLHAADLEKPFLMIASRTLDYTKLHALDPLLPFTVENATANELQVFTAVPEIQRNNPMLKLNNTTNTIEGWSKLPPIFRLQGTYRSKIESEVLVTFRLQSMPLSEPCVVARNVNKKKSLAVLGYGLWRWNMLSDAGNGAEPLLDHFIGNAVRWLTTQEDSRKIRVQPSKHIYTSQDVVEFSAQVYDDNYRPLDDAQVEVKVQNENETNSIVLNAIGSGQYQGAFESLRKGDYTFDATVLENGAAIGSDHGTFSIGGLNAEFLETQMNKSLLQQLSAQTGGRYYDSDNIRSLAQDIPMLANFKPRDVHMSARFEIWNSRWMLALIILIFALEWFLRKRMGML